MALKLTKGIFFGTGGAVLLTYGARKYREIVFGDRDDRALVHNDKSVAKIPIKSQVPATVKIIHPAKDNEGKVSVAIVDKQKVSSSLYKYRTCIINI